MRSSFPLAVAAWVVVSAGCALDWDHLRPVPGSDGTDGAADATLDGTVPADTGTDARTDARPRTDGPTDIVDGSLDGGATNDVSTDRGGNTTDGALDGGMTPDVPGMGMDVPVPTDNPAGMDVPADHGGMVADSGTDAGGLTDTPGVTDSGVRVDTGVVTDTGPGCISYLCTCAPGNPGGYCPIGGTCTAAGTCTGTAGPGSLLITEFMNYPRTVNDDPGEYVELYNPGSSPVDIRGLQIGNSRGEFVVLSGTAAVLIMPGAYALIDRNANPMLNGGLPTALYSLSLPLNFMTWGNTTGSVILDLGPGTPVIDQVDFDSTVWPHTRGHAKSRRPTAMDPLQSNVSTNWCDAPTLWPGSAGDYGSPGAANPACP